MKRVGAIVEIKAAATPEEYAINILEALGFDFERNGTDATIEAANEMIAEYPRIAFRRYSDKGGCGEVVLCQTTKEAVKIAKEEWGRLTKADKETYKKDRAATFCACVIHYQLRNDILEEFGYTPLWDALESYNDRTNDNGLWFAVMEGKDNEPWDYGAPYLADAKLMAERLGETAYIAVIDERGSFCLAELKRDELGRW